MNVRHALSLLPLLAGFALAPSARAQELGLHVRGHSVSVGFRFGRECAPVHQPPRPVGYAEREWIPGHYETITERVWIEGREERTWIEPSFAWQYDACGRARRVCTRPGYWKTYCTPGHFEAGSRQVWVDGGWRVRHCRS